MNRAGWVVFGVLAAGTVAALVVAGTAPLTPRENVLLSLILALFSIAASWLATHLYSQRSSNELRQTLKREYTQNLRTYALNAAEKVQNLSAEMGRLIEYVGTSIAQPVTADQYILCERLRAVHLALNTLRSTNNTALSDWRGIIGEELRLQADLESTVADVYRKLDRLEVLSEERNDSLRDLPVALQEVRTQIDAAASMISQVGPMPIRFRKKERLVAPATCPKCGSVARYAFSNLPNMPRVVDCSSCGVFYSVVIGDGLDVNASIVPTLTEATQCGVCNQQRTVVYPDTAVFNGDTFCPACGAHSLIHVSQGVLRLEPTGAAATKVLEIIVDAFRSTRADEQGIQCVAETTGLPLPLVKEGARLLRNSRRMPDTTTIEQTSAGITGTGSV